MDYGRVKARLMLAARPKKIITASRLLTLEDSDYLIIADSTNAINLTIPALSWELDTEIEIIQWNTGTVTITPGSGVTVNRFENPSNHVLSGRFAGAVVALISNNVWWLEGRFA